MLDGEDKIITCAVRGEASAFGSLYDHYQPHIYRFVLLKVSRREEAEDLTHQVFVSAFENIRTYENLGFPFSTWLYQIARNKVIDHYRAKKQEIDFEEADPEIFASSDMNDLTVDAKMELERAMKAIRKLKPEYQDVVIMRFIEELSLKETAEAIGKSEGAVKLLQHRAIKELKELLKTNANGTVRTS